MKKIEILELAIENLKGQSDNLRESITEAIEKNNERMKQTIAELLDFPVEFIERVSMSDYSTVIYVTSGGDDSSKFASELTIYNPRTHQKTHKLSYFATQVDDTKTQYLLYLELVGKVAKNMREGGELIPTLVEGTKTHKEVVKLDDELDEKVRQLTHEVRLLKREELLESASDGVTLLEEFYTYIKTSDTYQTGVKSVKPTKVTDKTITIDFYNGEEQKIRTCRFSVGQGEEMLVRFAQVLEEQKEVDKLV